MASLALLRKRAKEAGIAAAVIRKASTAEELQSIIDDHGGDEKPHKKHTVVAKKKGRTVAKKKATGKKNSTKPTRAKSQPAATSRQKSGKAKRTTAGTNGYVAKGGRNLLDGVDFTVTDGWNPREGSAPARIIAALRKARGNREKAYEALKGDIWDFVGKKMADGSKRTKDSAQAMLRYRISRTAWDFAMRTGQHESSDNRVEYGTGGTGEGVFKRSKSGSKTKTKAAPARKAGRKASSKKASAKKTTARKGGAKKRSTTKRR